MNYQLLPEDVMFQILSKLPANSVIRFKCVCKSWQTLLEDHSFIQKHTMNMTENTMMMRNPNHDHLLVSCRDNSTNKRVIISMSSSDSSSSSSSLISRFIINKKKELIPSSFSNNNYGQMRLIGPCNGIVCIYGYHDQIALCNPTIGDFKTLPSSTIQRPFDMNIRGGDVGLGYDSNTDDYKVIQILFCISIHRHNSNNNRQLVYNQIEIYSLRTNSWRKYDSRVPPYNYHIMHTSIIWSMVYKNKTLCWWAKNDDHMEMILSFDMEKEVFQETPLPSDIDEEFGGEKRTTRAIIPWKEKIGLVVYCMKEVEKFFDLWVVNGDDVLGANWTKVSRIGGIVGVERPLGFWKNGHELVLESSSRELVLYDLNSKEISNLGIYGKRDRLELLIYIPTLVSVNQYKRDNI